MSNNWTPARLIPTSGISGADEQETRATSALLAVMTIVRSFATSLLRPLGAPTGAVDAFIEVPLEASDGRTVRPDGLVRVSRGQRTWSALIEVKTGTNDLGREQIECYLDLARDNGIDAVVSISNQIAPAAGVHPVEVDKRKLRRVSLHHVSWAEILSTAVLERVHHGVDDPEQAWILAELIRYLQHPRSGALDFADMGGHWVSVREAVIAGTLRPADKGAADVASRWDQLLRFSALRLERDLGSGVQVSLARREQAEPTQRSLALRNELSTNGTLSGALRIPNTVGDLVIIADIRAGRCTVEVDIAAPTEGRALTRVNWLLRQLQDAPDGLRIDAFAHKARTSSSELLRSVRANPAVLLSDPKVDLRRFRVAAQSKLGTKRAAGQGAFIDSVLAAIDGFYETVLQDLRPWVTKPPQRPRSGSVLADAGIDTTVLPDEQISAGEDGVESPADETPRAGDNGDLIEWNDHEADIEQERTTGFPVPDLAMAPAPLPPPSAEPPRLWSQRCTSCAPTSAISRRHQSAGQLGTSVKSTDPNAPTTSYLLPPGFDPARFSGGRCGFSRG